MITFAAQVQTAGVGSTVGGYALLAAGIWFGWVSYKEELCQFCGFTKNQWKSSFPVCQKCGRNRVTGGAGPAHH